MVSISCIEFLVKGVVHLHLVGANVYGTIRTKLGICYISDSEHILPMSTQLPYVWDYDLTSTQFDQLLAGELTLGRLDRNWAAVRLLEYAPYREIVARLGFRALIAGWPIWRHRVRSESRKRGFDFLVEWLPKHHPELL